MTFSIENELADNVESYVPLNQSLICEIYNTRMWAWYREWGLIREIPVGDYVTFEHLTPVFHSHILKQTTQHGVLQKLRSSVVFPFYAARALAKYDAKSIDDFYDREKKMAYGTLNKQERREKFTTLWNMLVENIRYAFLAGLIAQYRLRIEIPAAFHDDIQAARYQALQSLRAGKSAKTSFDNAYGFLSRADYDFSVPRYGEMKTIHRVRYTPLVENPGPQRLRDHIRFRSAKIIALIRRLLLLTDGKEFFYKFKEEILQEKHRDVQRRVRAYAPHPRKRSTTRPHTIRGVTLSGTGTITGTVRVVNDLNEYAKVKKGEIAVTTRLSPDLVLVFPMVKGILSEKGGQLSHLAIVAREHHKVVLGQVLNATTILCTGQTVEVNAQTGTVHIKK